MTTASVVICTHDPRLDILTRVLEALQRQSLPQSRWQLLLIDNASTAPLGSNVSVSWHSNSKIIREDRLGLPSARCAGITASDGDVIIFVDDDNILCETYLEKAVAISERLPWLGAWGGSIVGEFQTTVPDEIQPYLGLLALRTVLNARWAHISNPIDCFTFIPYGAGLCVKRMVAEQYIERTRAIPLSLSLDRTGSSLSSSGDTDIALSACDLGLAIGLFPELHLSHIIPSNRLTTDYLLRLQEGAAYSFERLMQLREPSYTPYLLERPCRSERLFRFYQHLRSRFRHDTRQKQRELFAAQMLTAAQQGKLRAANDWKAVDFKEPLPNGDCLKHS